jgi:hypothetical protein
MRTTTLSCPQTGSVSTSYGAQAHYGEFIEDLKTRARIPSLSFPGVDPKEVDRSAEAVAALMSKRGLENVEILRIPRRPRRDIGGLSGALRGQFPD